eukprot:COSAG04_NODE_6730_length_1267_cov_30.994007_1_plen_240_part_10
MGGMLIESFFFARRPLTRPRHSRHPRQPRSPPRPPPRPPPSPAPASSAPPAGRPARRTSGCRRSSPYQSRSTPSPRFRCPPIARCPGPCIRRPCRPRRQPWSWRAPWVSAPPPRQRRTRPVRPVLRPAARCSPPGTARGSAVAWQVTVRLSTNKTSHKTEAWCAGRGRTAAIAGGASAKATFLRGCADAAGAASSAGRLGGAAAAAAADFNCAASKADSSKDACNNAALRRCSSAAARSV